MEDDHPVEPAVARRGVHRFDERVLRALLADHRALAARVLGVEDLPARNGPADRLRLAPPEVVDRVAQASDGVKGLQLMYPGAVQYVAADVTCTDDIESLLHAAVAQFGPVHTLVNNAAVFEMAPLLQADADSFDRLFAVNVKGMFFVMQAVLRHMVEAATAGASVINLASQAGRRGEA